MQESWVQDERALVFSAVSGIVKMKTASVPVGVIPMRLNIAQLELSRLGHQP